MNNIYLYGTSYVLNSASSGNDAKPPFDLPKIDRVSNNKGGGQSFHGEKLEAGQKDIRHVRRIVLRMRA